jgi:hypothetical protein
MMTCHALSFGLPAKVAEAGQLKIGGQFPVCIKRPGSKGQVIFGDGRRGSLFFSKSACGRRALSGAEIIQSPETGSCLSSLIVDSRAH